MNNKARTPDTNEKIATNCHLVWRENDAYAAHMSPYFRAHRYQKESHPIQNQETVPRKQFYLLLLLFLTLFTPRIIVFSYTKCFYRQTSLYTTIETLRKRDNK